MTSYGAATVSHAQDHSRLQPEGRVRQDHAIAVNLAQAFANLDLRVLVADMDPQGSALDWAWEAKDFDVVDAGSRIAPANLRRIRNQYDVTLIDCPPQYSEASAEAIRIADLALVPVQPSQLDLWATIAIVDLIKARQSVAQGNPKAVFVMSRVVLGTLVAQRLRETLAQQDFPVLANFTTQRVAYAEAARLGRTVFGVNAPRARREIEAIRDEIKELIL